VSAPSALVFFGLRFEVASEQESESLELRTDARIVRARAAQLDHYFGTFQVGDRTRDLLFIGKKLASVGLEMGAPGELSQSELEDAVKETALRLAAAGWETRPRLFVEFEPDF
jgi:hypothetical protein